MCKHEEFDRIADFLDKEFLDSLLENPSGIFSHVFVSQETKPLEFKDLKEARDFLLRDRV